MAETKLQSIVLTYVQRAIENPRIANSPELISEYHYINLPGLLRKHIAYRVCLTFDTFMNDYGKAFRGLHMSVSEQGLIKNGDILRYRAPKQPDLEEFFGFVSLFFDNYFSDNEPNLYLLNIPGQKYPHMVLTTDDSGTKSKIPALLPDYFVPVNTL